MKRRGVFIIWMLAISILFFASTSFSQNLKVTKESPATVTGTLRYASMKYWIELPKGKSIDLLPENDDALENKLSEMVGKKITLSGIMKTYQDGSKYLYVSMSGLGSSTKKTETTTFTTGKESKAILYNGKIVYQNDECFSLDIKKVFSIGNNKVALVQINSGGTACPAEYIFITAKTSGAPILSKKFGNCSDIPKITVKGDKIALKFPGNPPETWTYFNGDVRK